MRFFYLMVILVILVYSLALGGWDRITGDAEHQDNPIHEQHSYPEEQTRVAAEAAIAMPDLDEDGAIARFETDIVDFAMAGAQTRLADGSPDDVAWESARWSTYTHGQGMIDSDEADTVARIAMRFTEEEQ